MFTGKDLIALGYTPAHWFKDAINAVNSSGLTSNKHIKSLVDSLIPAPTVTIPLQNGSSIPQHYNIDVTTPDEVDNLDKVKAHIEALATVPTIRALSVMPDACPAGKETGTIPVGGIAVADNAIHPGMHSADICCSVAISVFDDTDATAILDAGMKLSHFGAGGRNFSFDMQPTNDLMERFEKNPFLSTLTGVATKHFGTQGDGNHFFYVGRIESSGKIALVTHHGSRKPGAMLYKRGMDAAQKATAIVSPETPAYNAWLVADSADGQAYWQALQLIRRWTKGSHFAIHDSVAKYLNIKVKDRWWNEHNFVFQKPDGLFYHAKGATPNYSYFAADATDLTLIPLNMAAPIIIAKTRSTVSVPLSQDTTLGFAPHGAGRNFSRTRFTKNLIADGVSLKDMIAEQTGKLDIRAFSGKYDISEFPDAYKPPQSIIDAIKKYDLTTIEDLIQPIGSIMAGHSGYVRR
jgi:tRNA-splicing ligase RtcB